MERIGARSFLVGAAALVATGLFVSFVVHKWKNVVEDEMQDKDENTKKENSRNDCNNSNCSNSSSNNNSAVNADSNKGSVSSGSNGPRRVRILYGSVTGTAKNMAFKLASMIEGAISASSVGLSVMDVKDYDEDCHLDGEDILLFLCCTWTDGKPPDSAARFLTYLEDFAHDFRVSKNHLSKVSFAVFGLGGAIYQDNFGKPARQAHAYLVELGATPLLLPMLGDDASDLESKFAAWSSTVVSLVSSQVKSSGGQLKQAHPPHMEQVEQIKQTQDTEAINAPELNKGKKDKTKVVQKHSVKRGNAFQQQAKVVKAEMSKKSGQCGSHNNNQKEGNNDCCGNASNGNECCNNNNEEEEEEEEEEDKINNAFVDMEDLGVSTNSDPNSTQGATTTTATSNSTQVPREMVTKAQRRALTKEGYRIIGSHSAVKLCRWTKNQMRGRGGCYKHTFYGITSYQCMEATPSLACANKCVFCWRHHKNPVGTEWRWKEDDPEYIVEEAVELHRSMINEMRGVPGVLPERLQEGFTVRHCALSLVGEPIMYPHINKLLAALHNRHISSFLVTNAQFPESIKTLDPVTQLYVSVDASTRDSLKAIDRPIFKDFWERFIQCLQEMRKRRQRTVYRMTLVKSWNMEDCEGYAELIELGQPDFIEIKAVTYCGKSDASTLTIQNSPWHTEVCAYSEALANRLNERGNLGFKYSIATEHAHSCCILLAREDKFKIDGVWHTWIDYPRFDQLMQKYYASGGKEVFDSVDYMARTPDWALYQSSTQGFDPEEQRWRRNKQGNMVLNEYKSSDSGCG